MGHGCIELAFGTFVFGVIVGLLIGPATERLEAARIDGWLDGFRFEKRHP